LRCIAALQQQKQDDGEHAQLGLIDAVRLRQTAHMHMIRIMPKTGVSWQLPAGNQHNRDLKPGWGAATGCCRMAC
jgi:hypothetical protein